MRIAAIRREGEFMTTPMRSLSRRAFVGWGVALAAGSVAGCSNAEAPSLVPAATAVTTHSAGGTGASTPAAPATSSSAEFTFERQASPDRTVVKQGGTVVATLTDGARTAVLEGPSRTFAEPETTRATVTTNAWVRLLPQEWTAGAENAAWFKTWFNSMRGSTEPDVFAVAFEYTPGAPIKKDASGHVIAGDAQFGPMLADGVTRLDGTDYVDYLGVPQKFPDLKAPKQPDPARLGMLDCSGFIRMVTGYRLGYPLLGTNNLGKGLPRRAWAILDNGPGVQLIANTGQVPANLDMLQPGDFLFFEVDSRDPKLDHMGMYLGVDSQGERRFVSSRMRANGPTMGDTGGASTIGVRGLYSGGLRGARRI